MFQKAPFMINMPGLKGGINHTYGGEIDVLPTLEDLLELALRIIFNSAKTCSPEKSKLYRLEMVIG